MKSIAEAKWEVDPANCVGCGDCVVICPVSVFTILPPPCQTACPINSDVRNYICLIQQQRFDEALASILQVNPFPGITGRVCTRLCEKECRRGQIDEPIAIKALERFAAKHRKDYEKPQASHIEDRGESVAIVGSGPAGLIAAWDLTRMGHHVTIFESLPVAGGMLHVGIPEYRLPREIIKAEIHQIEQLGVEIRLNTTIGKDIKLDSLFEQGYRAVLLATGAHNSLKLEIPGENRFEGVIDAIWFLQKVNLGQKKKMGGKAIIVGGGHAAIDSARTLLRIDCKEVDIIYRRTIKEMPAIESELIEAEREGVRIHYLVSPTKVIGKNGRVVGLECIRIELGEPDDSGRRKPMPIAGSEFFMETDLVIPAIGQKPDLSFLSENDHISISEQGLIRVDTDTLYTNKDGVFAAGDNVTGPATVIDALAAGRRAAVSINSYIRCEDLKEEHKEKAGARMERYSEIWWKEMPKSELRKIPVISIKEHSFSFKEVELGLTQSLALEEARRCLKCDLFAHMDLESCCRESCRICEYACPQNVIRAY
ncbi:MAG: FAD-dependent oxidoreductase [Alphaproteobacteria bacterium]